MRELVRSHMTGRPRDRDLAVSLEQPPYVDERHGDHPTGVVVLDAVAFRAGERVRGRALLAPDVQIQNVATLVVLVSLEGDGGDGDAHGCSKLKLSRPERRPRLRLQRSRSSRLRWV